MYEKHLHSDMRERIDLGTQTMMRMNWKGYNEEVRFYMERGEKLDLILKIGFSQIHFISE